MRILLAIGGSIMLAACGSSDTTTFEAEDGTSEFQVDGSDAEMRFTDNEGSETTVTSGSKVDVDLPDGFTIYPGADVVSNTVINGNDGQGTLVVMTSSASVDDMVAHYRRQAEAAGIDIGMEMTTNANRMIGGEGPNGAMFSFTATASDDRTTGMLTVGRDSAE